MTTPTTLAAQQPHLPAANKAPGARWDEDSIAALKTVSLGIARAYGSVFGKAALEAITEQYAATTATSTITSSKALSSHLARFKVNDKAYAQQLAEAIAEHQVEDLIPHLNSGFSFS